MLFTRILEPMETIMSKLSLCGSVLIAFSLSAGVLAGGGAAAGEVTPERATEIALEQTGGGEVMNMGRHSRGGGVHYYRFEILSPIGAFHVEIDSTDGSLIQFIKKYGGKGYKGYYVPSAPAASTPGNGNGTVITQDQALAIAMQITGGGTVVDRDVDVKKWGRVVYEYEIVNDGIKHEIEIDSFGNVIDYEQKRSRRYFIPTPVPDPAASSAPSAGTAAAPRTKLDLVAIQALAKEQVGGGTVTEYKYDAKKTPPSHEITIVRENRRYELEMDEDGNVQKLSEKLVD